MKPRSGRGSLGKLEPSQSIELKDGTLSPSTDAEIAIESLLTLSGGRSAPKTPPAESNQDELISRAPVPKLARLLRDGHGKFIFVGDSSNLAFLQNIRRLVKAAIGDCQLTNDPKRHAMIECVPADRILASRQPVSGPKPDATEARDLVHHYLLASSGIIDLFDPVDIVQHLTAWAEDPEAETHCNSSLYYLISAIGGQARGNGSEELAERRFARGWEMAITGFANDPSVLTIQSHALVTLYMLITCRRNAAFMLLGIATRAAHALGLHRSDISTLFEPRERKTRERLWKSLRVLDLFMSASLGRPPATSEVDGGYVSWDRPSRDYEDIQMAGLNSSAMLRISFILERIMNEVYTRREVSVQLVESISRQFRDWTSELPAGLETDGLVCKDGQDASSLQQTIGVTHVKSAYHWSIILLTRPFLIFKVSSRIRGHNEQDSTQGPSIAQTLSEACIDAALRGIELATDIIYSPGIPKRMFLVINSTFVSALVLGFAIFGDFDKAFPLLSSLDQARAVLAVQAKDDPAARRYMQITQYLHQAATEHIRRRDRKEAQRRRQDIHSIFGDLLHKDSISETNSTQNGGDKVLPIPFVQPAGMSFSHDIQDFPWQQHIDMLESGAAPILTTSGIPASTGRDFNDFANGEGRPVSHEADNAGGLSPGDSGIPSLPSYAEEFPLFSLMSDFDQFTDPFSMGMG